MTLTTRSDLRNWIWERISDATEADIESITNAIQADDHPRWGNDWTEYLESLPENLHEVISE